MNEDPNALERQWEANDPNKREEGVSGFALLTVGLILITGSIVSHQLARLLMEWFSAGVSYAIAIPVVIIVIALIFWISLPDFVDLVVGLCILTILSLLLVPAIINKRHRDAETNAPRAPARVEKLKQY